MLALRKIKYCCNVIFSFKDRNLLTRALYLYVIICSADLAPTVGNFSTSFSVPSFKIFSTFDRSKLRSVAILVRRFFLRYCNLHVLDSYKLGSTWTSSAVLSALNLHHLGSTHTTRSPVLLVFHVAVPTSTYELIISKINY